MTNYKLLSIQYSSAALFTNNTVENYIRQFSSFLLTESSWSSSTTMATAEQSTPGFKVPTLFLQFSSGGLANAITSSILNPMDVSKTRMQAEQASGNAVGKSGLFQTAKRLYAEGGIVGLWRPGLSASICRELVYSGSRAGMYVPVRNYYREKFGSESVMMKIAAAMTTGTNEYSS